MKQYPRMRPVELHCLWVGAGLASFGMLLHPSSPEDFLALALLAPASAWQDGPALALLLFWSGVAALVLAAGIALGDLVHGIASLLRHARPHRDATPARPSW